MSGSRNRNAGHGWERDSARGFRECSYPFVVTTRSESKSRDDKGIDLMNKDEYKNGLFEFSVQCKCTQKNPDYHSLIEELPKDFGIPIVFHRKTLKTKTRFRVVGEYATLRVEDFYNLLRKINGITD